MNLFQVVTGFMAEHVWAMVIGTACYCALGGWLARSMWYQIQEEELKDYLAEEVEKGWQDE